MPRHTPTTSWPATATACPSVARPTSSRPTARSPHVAAQEVVDGQAVFRTLSPRGLLDDALFNDGITFGSAATSRAGPGRAGAAPVHGPGWAGLPRPGPHDTIRRPAGSLRDGPGGLEGRLRTHRDDTGGSSPTPASTRPSVSPGPTATDEAAAGIRAAGARDGLGIPGLGLAPLTRLSSRSRPERAADGRRGRDSRDPSQ